tara:strand:- start:1106 stop:1369 length:264 start_codon:yes stop_codon:yes gene_type:complete
MKHHVRDFAANRSIRDMVSARAVVLSRSVLTALFASDHIIFAVQADHRILMTVSLAAIRIWALQNARTGKIFGAGLARRQEFRSFQD